MIYPRLAIIDLETTGGDAQRDRITEVAILVTEGDALIERWSSLVNPGIPIPLRIQEFTGIDDDMVRNAPSFDMLAREIRERLEGCVFVAHNARFDYNFLRAAFERCEQEFAAPVMCSVKFSRALHPEHPRHGLDAIIAREGYSIASRHRAMDDAEVVWRFLQDCRARHAAERLQQAWLRAHSSAPNVPRLPQGEIEGLSDGWGVYVLRGRQGEALKIAAARSLRTEVLSIFTRREHSSRKLAAQIDAVESRPCAGELDAHLVELQLRRSLMEQKPTPAMAWCQQDDGSLQLHGLNGSDPQSWSQWRGVFGAFRGEQEAVNILRPQLIRARLCPQRVGLERSSGPCQAYRLKRCAGVCADAESADAHDQRLRDTLAPFAPRAWPFEGPISIRCADERNGSAATLVFDQWCLVGRYADDELPSASPPAFDGDVQRILQRWLAVPGNVPDSVLRPR